jgi:hypothetical protein
VNEGRGIADCDRLWLPDFSPAQCNGRSLLLTCLTYINPARRILWTLTTSFWSASMIT